MEILQGVWEVIVSIFTNSGYAYFFTADGGYKNAIMLLVAFVFLYLGIKKGFEPLLMVPIAFGMLLANIPEANLAVQYHDLDGFRDLLAGRGEFVGCTPGLMDFLYFGVKAGIYPPLIFLGIGAMTDFAPLIANPSSFILGAAAQLGIFFTYLGAILLGFAPNEAGSIAIIGGADGYFCNVAACAVYARHYRRGGVLVYGSCACYSAAYYESTYNQEREKRCYGQPQTCIKA